MPTNMNFKFSIHEFRVALRHDKITESVKTNEESSCFNNNNKDINIRNFTNNEILDLFIFK